MEWLLMGLAFYIYLRYEGWAKLGRLPWVWPFIPQIGGGEVKLSKLLFLWYQGVWLDWKQSSYILVHKI